MWFSEQTERIGRGENPRVRFNASGHAEVFYSAGGSVYATRVSNLSLTRFVCEGDEAAYTTDGTMIVRKGDTLCVQ